VHSFSSNSQRYLTELLLASCKPPGLTRFHSPLQDMYGVESSNHLSCFLHHSLNPLELDAILHATLVDAGSLPSKAGKSGAPRTVQESATALQQALEDWTYAEPERLAQAKSGEYSVRTELCIIRVV